MKWFHVSIFWESSISRMKQTLSPCSDHMWNHSEFQDMKWFFASAAFCSTCCRCATVTCHYYPAGFSGAACLNTTVTCSFNHGQFCSPPDGFNEKQLQGPKIQMKIMSQCKTEFILSNNIQVLISFSILHWNTVWPGHEFPEIQLLSYTVSLMKSHDLMMFGVTEAVPVFECMNSWTAPWRPDRALLLFDHRHSHQSITSTVLSYEESIDAYSEEMCLCRFRQHSNHTILNISKI